MGLLAIGFQYYVEYTKAYYHIICSHYYVNDLIAQLRHSGSGAHMQTVYWLCVVC